MYANQFFEVGTIMRNRFIFSLVMSVLIAISPMAIAQDSAGSVPGLQIRNQLDRLRSTVLATILLAKDPNSPWQEDKYNLRGMALNTYRIQNTIPAG